MDAIRRGPSRARSPRRRRGLRPQTRARPWTRPPGGFQVAIAVGPRRPRLGTTLPIARRPGPTPEHRRPRACRSRPHPRRPPSIAGRPRPVSSRSRPGPRRPLSHSLLPLPPSGSPPPDLDPPLASTRVAASRPRSRSRIDRGAGSTVRIRSGRTPSAPSRPRSGRITPPAPQNATKQKSSSLLPLRPLAADLRCISGRSRLSRPGAL